jgi:hypothetical protein
MKCVPAGENTELVGSYVGEKSGCGFEPGMYQALAVINESGDFCAGVVVSDFRGHDCQMSCAAETSVAWRGNVLNTIFEYVFNQLGCARCTAITKKSNRRTREFLERIGFQLEGRLRLGFDGTKDALIYGLLASECPYIVHNDGDEQFDDRAKQIEDEATINDVITAVH